MQLGYWASLLCETLRVSGAFALAIRSGKAASTPGTPGSNPAAPATRNRWDNIKSRGQVICGVSGEVPGFSFVGTDGKYSGIDVDICRAIAAALFDNPDAVEFRNLNSKERFTALQTGIDKRSLW